MRRSLIILLLSATATGCARAPVTYPSLAERPAERRGFEEPRTAAVEPPRPDPALDARIAALIDRSREVAIGFDRDWKRAEALARGARGRPAGSEPWLEAQSALAALDDWRAQASALVTDTEQLAGERAAELLPPYPPLDAARKAAAAEAERQGAIIEKLSAGLPSA